MTSHQFGGDWTTEKLERVRKYLAAYTTIFKSNERARKLRTIYVDAFAGTGYRTRGTTPDHQQLLPFPELTEPDAEAFLKGSARIALEVEPPFNQYMFIERDPARAKELERLKSDFPDRNIKIIEQEANDYLKQWCDQINWSRSRSVVFLDPYGMQVSWSLIEKLGETKAVDLWILFPLGAAVNRLLTRKGLPDDSWSDALTRIFGTDEWKNAFYSQETRTTLFGEEEEHHAKKANFDTIGNFFVKRLKTVFHGVADNPLALYNSRNNPLYLLCFASANPKGAKTAIKIAKNILRK